MIKRLHEYKRQMLKLLHVATMYRRLRLDPAAAIPPRMVLFGAKAAPGYQMAKLIIRLINQVGATIAADPAMAGRLSVVFPANYNVTLAERIIPAADLSEQISMAGKEASGTGNMKLSLNGALTIGTLDGANVEIRELVGADNFFLFGLTEDEVVARKAAGYNPGTVYREDEELRAVIDEIASGYYSPPGEPDLFRPIIETLLMRDEYLVLADYRSYIEAQERVDAAVGRQGGVDGDVDPQHGADRVLLLRPLDARLLRPHLEVVRVGPVGRPASLVGRSSPIRGVGRFRRALLRTALALRALSKRPDPASRSPLESARVPAGREPGPGIGHRVLPCPHVKLSTPPLPRSRTRRSAAPSPSSGWSRTSGSTVARSMSTST